MSKGMMEIILLDCTYYKNKWNIYIYIYIYGMSESINARSPYSNNNDCEEEREANDESKINKVIGVSCIIPSVNKDLIDII